MEVLTQQHAHTRAKAAKFFAVFMSLVLCVSMTPHISWAAESSETFSVALTIVDTTDDSNGLLANVKVDGLSSENTVADLLAEAGFTKVDDVESTINNDKAYADSYGSPVFRGNKMIQNADSTYTYWVSMYNGDSANYDSAMLESKLQESGHYQYVYTNGTTFTYTAGIADPLSGGNAGGDEAAAVNTYDANDATELMDRLLDRFTQGGKDAAISNSTMYAAVAANASWLGASLDASAILESMNGYKERTGYDMGAGQYGKYIMALTAAGVDCTAVSDNGATRNLVDEMEAVLDFDAVTEYDAVFILPVYSYDGYESGLDEAPAQKLIDLLVNSVDENGLFGKTYGADLQTSAQAILALMPYAGANEKVEGAVSKAAEAILAAQNEDGGFGYSLMYTDSDIDTTATVIAALSVLGTDCAYGDAVTTENGSTPAGYLVAQADDTQDGYTTSSSYDETMTSATALMGLVASRMYTYFGGAYNVYSVNEITPGETAHVKRIAGYEAENTAVAISQGTYAAGSCSNVILATDRDFMDSMSATGLAGALDCPILLVNSDGTLYDDVEAEIERLGAKHAYIIGGEHAISYELENQISQELQISTERVYGNEAPDTSVKCANEIMQVTGGSLEYAVVARADNFQDALSMSSFASAYKAALILAPCEEGAAATELPSGGAEVAQAASKQVFIAGGEKAVDEKTLAGVVNNVERLAGTTAYDTSDAIARYMVGSNLLDANGAVLASGAQAAKGLDALAGAAFASNNRSVLLLVNGNESYEAVDTTCIDGFIASNASSIDYAFALGGTSVMPADILTKVDALISQE